MDTPMPTITKHHAVLELTLEWRHLELKAKFKNPRTSQLEEKTILNDVSGHARPGELVVLMGPSGAGKSSLLDCISGRNPAVQGAITVNGQPWTKSLKRLASYVVQDDLFYETITVYEHLVFQARLRMGKTLTRQQQEQRVTAVMEDLGLTKCRDALIGGQRIRGISGGERKRLSFATEVLTNPSLLFVDEPTSGLDSFMAETVVEQLQQMARDGRTVIATIHQPSSEIFALFDVLYLLVDGGTAYHGRATDAVTYFAGLGLQCPSFMNPSDYLMEQLAIRESNPDGIERVERLKQEWKKERALLTHDDQPHSFRELQPGDSLANTPIEDTRLGVLQQAQLLCARNMTRTVRNKIAFRAMIFQALFVSVIIGLVFLQLDLTQTGIQNFAGVSFFLSINQTFSAANPTFVAVPMELPILEREFKAGLYRLGSWYLAKNISELPLQVLQPVLYFVPAYLMVGFGGGFLVYL
ncbi:TPA: hypothetical protein N0F65_009515 [Lagenidium giganteum]|uniref:ABC transporter domain-containing protein n=1 Tax=Lagenidium giganteum TaxID=4803 RepID=A0AAV2YZ24_9STRA|nr:TPA: hypothetical protein N0F65_009515 [Lagenidium giganteum]